MRAGCKARLGSRGAGAYVADMTSAPGSGSADPARHVRAWRDFKRMQAAAAVFASLVYLGAAVHAWEVVPASAAAKRAFLLVFPAIYLMAVLVVALQLKIVRRRLKRYVWLSFASGFGQTPVSVLTGLGVLAAAAGLIYWRVHASAAGGPLPAGAFSAFGAGIGVLLAQLLLVSALEREPKIREIIEA